MLKWKSLLLLLLWTWGSLVTCNSSNSRMVLESETAQLSALSHHHVTSTSAVNQRAPVSMPTPIPIALPTMLPTPAPSNRQETLLFMILAGLTAEEMTNYPALGTALKQAIATMLDAMLVDVKILSMTDVDVVGTLSASVNVEVDSPYTFTDCQEILQVNTARFLDDFKADALQGGYTMSLDSVHLTSVFASTLAPSPVPTPNPSAYPSPLPSQYPTPKPSEYPTLRPTFHPSAHPTVVPTPVPSDRYWISSTVSLSISCLSAGQVVESRVLQYSLRAAVAAVLEVPISNVGNLTVTSGAQLSMLVTSQYDVGNAREQILDDQVELVNVFVSTASGMGYSASALSCTSLTGVTVMTLAPTASPTLHPTTATPTTEPSPEPSALPTVRPTALPTLSPTPDPTQDPTSVPTSSAPSSSAPTSLPSAVPSAHPTRKPTHRPTKEPTPVPSASPTEPPTSSPTQHPTISFRPTSSPSPAPTLSLEQDVVDWTTVLVCILSVLLIGMSLYATVTGRSSYILYYTGMVTGVFTYCRDHIYLPNRRQYQSLRTGESQVALTPSGTPARTPMSLAFSSSPLRAVSTPGTERTPNYSSYSYGASSP